MAKIQDDFTKAKQATNQEEVDAQDTRTKLYQSLGYTYGQQQEQSNKNYDQAISQQDRSMLSRGMQRSSYGMQVLGNLQDQKVKESNRIGEAMIADYQNRVFQQEEAEAARKFQTAEREAQQSWQSAENALQRAMEENQFAQSQEYNYAQLAQQKELTNAQLEQNQSQFDIQQAFNERQWEAQQDQWKEEFEYNKKSDAQKIAYNYIVAAAAQGGDVSDDLLASAGISREDYNAMKTQAKSSGRGYTPKPGPGNGDEDKSGILTQEQLEALAGADSVNGKTGAFTTGPFAGNPVTPKSSNNTTNWAYVVGTSPVNSTEKATTTPSVSVSGATKDTKSPVNGYTPSSTYTDYAYEIASNEKKKNK